MTLRETGLIRFGKGTVEDREKFGNDNNEVTSKEGCNCINDQGRILWSKQENKGWKIAKMMT